MSNDYNRAQGDVQNFDNGVDQSYNQGEQQGEQQGQSRLCSAIRISH